MKFLAVTLSATLAAAASPEYSVRSLSVADRITRCSYTPLVGVFTEMLWQSGSTLETVSNALILSRGTNLQMNLSGILSNTFAKTPAIVDHCFDDHSWFMLGWAQAYKATNELAYLQRSAEIFDFVAVNGWDNYTSFCGGGVLWCPPPTGVYKNAITSELFLTSAMTLHPYASLLGKDSQYFLSWGKKVWAWFNASGMVNQEHLVNDGLQGLSCVNNNQTTWTYNQGVLLSGLYLLSNATGDPSYSTAAVQIATAAMDFLTLDGVLTEPCPGGACGGDGEIFKGVFVRHLGYVVAWGQGGGVGWAALPPSFLAQATAFLQTNAQALVASTCASGEFPFDWASGLCDVSTTATTSAALDLLIAAANAGVAPLQPPTFSPIGVGNCEDSRGASMANCFKDGVPLDVCRDAAFNDPGALAFDFKQDCVGVGAGGFCRVRTTSGSGGCGGGFTYQGGVATSVTGGDGGELATCYLRRV